MKLVRKILSFLRKLFHPVKFAERYGKRRLKALLLAYLVAFIPANYTFTSLTTSIPFTHIKQVSEQSLKSGILNLASLGTLKPTFNALKFSTGKLLQGFGDFAQIDEIHSFGVSLTQNSRKWFQAGKNLANEKISDATKKVPIISGVKEISGSQPELGISELPKQIDNQPKHSQSSSEVTTLSGASSAESTELGANKVATDKENYYRVAGSSGLTLEDFFAKEGCRYSELDDKGRTLKASAVVTYQMIQKSKGVREKFEKGSDPSGWPDGKKIKNNKVEIKHTDGKVYHGYFYNRSHLIADQLGGRAFRNNLITGTRTQNVGRGNGGMRYSEAKVVDYITKHPNVKVLYVAKPIYSDDGVVPSIVIVKMLSSDYKINETVEVYNVCIGYSIDYRTGSYRKL